MGRLRMRRGTSKLTVALTLAWFGYGCTAAESAERPERLRAETAVVVDNESPGFSKVGRWNRSTRDKGYEGSNYLWSRRGSGGNKATFIPRLPRAGTYEVFVKWVASKPGDRATNAPFTVRFAGGEKTVRVNLARREDAGKWYSLGSYRFEAGRKQGLRPLAAQIGPRPGEYLRSPPPPVSWRPVRPSPSSRFRCAGPSSAGLSGFRQQDSRD